MRDEQKVKETKKLILSICDFIDSTKAIYEHNEHTDEIEREYSKHLNKYR